MSHRAWCQMDFCYLSTISPLLHFCLCRFSCLVLRLFLQAIVLTWAFVLHCRHYTTLQKKDFFNSLIMSTFLCAISYGSHRLMFGFAIWKCLNKLFQGKYGTIEKTFNLIILFFVFRGVIVTFWLWNVFFAVPTIFNMDAWVKSTYSNFILMQRTQHRPFN